MLVLARRPGESIMIGDDIEFRVLAVSGGAVKVGVQAPREVPIFRKEIYLEIQQERLEPGTSARAEVDEALKHLTSD